MNIFKKVLAGSSAIFLASSLFAGTAFASAEHLNWGSQINAGQCQKVGKPVVNVVQKVINDVDSGQGGNNWAFDNLNRQIQLWATSTSGEYCAEVSYQGKFDAQAGQISPGTTGILNGSEDGSFQGGYNATITGTLLSTPLWQTRGSVGMTDNMCDLTTGVCPGYVDWVAQYFGPTYGFSFNWWGWIYRNGNHVWVNSVDGNSGDVL